MLSQRPLGIPTQVMKKSLVRVTLGQFCQRISNPEKSKLFLKCESPHLAILIHIWHIWEDGSRKVNMKEPKLRFTHGTFDLLWARPFENLLRRVGYGFYLFPKNGRYQDLGTRILVPGSWYKILVPRSLYQDLGTTRILVRRSWYLPFLGKR